MFLGVLRSYADESEMSVPHKKELKFSEHNKQKNKLHPSPAQKFFKTSKIPAGSQRQIHQHKQKNNHPLPTTDYVGPPISPSPRIQPEHNQHNKGHAENTETQQSQSNPDYDPISQNNHMTKEKDLVKSRYAHFKNKNVISTKTTSKQLKQPNYNPHHFSKANKNSNNLPSTHPIEPVLDSQNAKVLKIPMPLHVHMEPTSDTLSTMELIYPPSPFSLEPEPKSKNMIGLIGLPSLYPIEPNSHSQHFPKPDNLPPVHPVKPNPHSQHLPRPNNLPQPLPVEPHSHSQHLSGQNKLPSPHPDKPNHQHQNMPGPNKPPSLHPVECGPQHQNMPGHNNPPSSYPVGCNPEHQNMPGQNSLPSSNPSVPAFASQRKFYVPAPTTNPPCNPNNISTSTPCSNPGNDLPGTTISFPSCGQQPGSYCPDNIPIGIVPLPMQNICAKRHANCREKCTHKCPKKC
ncbi:hypothetical protein HZS_3605, partial [Henneguya salminicola]